MRLAKFIESNFEPILVEWESFARNIWPPGTPVEPAELRDSAREILQAVVADMDSLQTLHEQAEKSHGRRIAGVESEQLDHASYLHGTARVGSGLSMALMVAEYRALRASVLRLWRASKPDTDIHDLDDITRFNEAIDQSLAIAVGGFLRRIDTARKLFLGVLAHDLRNPLSAITLSAKVAQATLNDPSELQGHLAQIGTSARAMGELITDLIDFASGIAGSGLPMSPERSDLHLICHEVMREIHAAYPGRAVLNHLRGDLNGTWDANRLRQLIINLLANALQHGSESAPVTLTVHGTDPEAVVIAVHNHGEPIPASLLPTIFDPLVRGVTSIQNRRIAGSTGLGLYIVREIATAHGGSACLTSTADQGTTATVRLPRHAKQ